MWDKVKRRVKSLKRPKRDSELYFATHYHLIPLYVISGLLIVTVLIMGCYVRFLWETEQAAGWSQIGTNVAAANEQRFLTAVSNPVDKKQYLYPANIRFTTTDPYQILRYSYDPGLSIDKNGAAVSLTTSRLLQTMGMPLQRLGPDNFNLVSKLQQCSPLYVIRFEPGSTQYGGFSPLSQVKLKDGRTAYIHKNTNCITEENDGGHATTALEATLQTIESY